MTSSDGPDAPPRAARRDEPDEAPGQFGRACQVGKVGRVGALWRYPVKSVGGERLVQVSLDRRGVVGDRRWAVVGDDGKIGSGKSTRRFRRMPGLLSLRSVTDPEGTVWVQFPSGERRNVTDPETAASIGSLVGERVRLLEESSTPHMDDGPVHIVTTGAMASLAKELGEAIDECRFRPNVVIDTDEPSDAQWDGRRLQMGTATLHVVEPTERCVMVTMAQPDVAFRPAVLGEIGDRFGGTFGQYATVAGLGKIAVGDPVFLR